MSRYPSESVERFDQQFAETEGERNERLAAARNRKALRDPPDFSGQNEIMTMRAGLNFIIGYVGDEKDERQQYIAKIAKRALAAADAARIRLQNETI